MNVARSVTKKGKHGGDRGNPYLKAVEGTEIITPVKRDADIYRESIVNRGDRVSSKGRIETKEELIGKIHNYLATIQDADGKYHGAPSLSGLGAYLGYSSRGWHYNAPHQDILDHFRLWLDAWRVSKMVVPRGGVNPAALMFMVANGVDSTRQEETKDITPTDDRPADAAALIDDVWKQKGE